MEDFTMTSARASVRACRQLRSLISKVLTFPSLLALKVPPSILSALASHPPT
jgi:hypothetical protein